MRKKKKERTAWAASLIKYYETACTHAKEKAKIEQQGLNFDFFGVYSTKVESHN